MPGEAEHFGVGARPHQVLDDRYELVERVGAGGMAEVWAARDARLGRQVAVKVITGAMDESKRRKFEREARALAAVSHPNIVRVFDYGEATAAGGNVVPYVVMELVDGPDLQRYLTDRGPLPVAEAQDVLGRILTAVEVAHVAGIVHGDLKPANIFMGSHGPKVGDFGVARILDEETGSTTVAATPTFAAPEVLKGERPTTASDVYSAGCLAYQLLVGRPPYEGTNAWEIASKHIEAPVPKVSKGRTDVPAELATAIQRAMNKDARRRHPSAASFAAAVAPASQGATANTVPVTSTPPIRGDATEALTHPRPVTARAALLGPLAGAWERGTAFVRGHGRGSRVAALAVVALLLLVAILLMRDGGPRVVAMPNVIGDPYREAAAQLREDGFTVEVSIRLADQGRAGRVIESIPRASVEVEPGAKVHLIVGAVTATPEQVVQDEGDDDDEEDNGDDASKGAEEARKKLEEQQKKLEEEQKKQEEEQRKAGDQRD